MELHEVLRRIEDRLDQVGLSATAASKAAGLSSDAIRNLRRAVKEDPERGVSMKTLSALAPVLGTSAAWLLEGGADEDAGSELHPSARGLVPAPLAGTVEAGAWREVDEFDQSEPTFIALPPDERFPNATQEVFRVSGDSMNALEPHPISPGSRVISLRYDEIAGRVPLRDGLVVVVQRSRDGGHVRELSVKQVEFYGDRIEFHPRSSNPKHKPIIVEHDVWEDNGVVVQILGLVRRIENELPI